MVSSGGGFTAQRTARRFIRASKNKPVYKNVVSTSKGTYGECGVTSGSSHEWQDTSVPPSPIKPGKGWQRGWMSSGAWEAAYLWLGRAWSSLTGSLDLRRHYCGWFLSLYFLRESSDTSSSYSQIRWPVSLFNSHCIAGETIKKVLSKEH